MSKKLSGNGRWESSRMMLPEHREQLLDQEKEGGVSTSVHNKRVPDKDELLMIRDFIILPVVLTMTNKNLADIENSAHSLKTLYAKVTRIMMDMISMDLYRIKREMKQRNIKVFEEEQADGIMYYRYIYKGYQEKFGMVREVLRAEVSMRMTKYIRDVIMPLSKTKE
ncbi:hypothetical protein [Cohnella abietis]|uniref:Uncharacterized protein n=1 Tax=Cohnella abietis TaxID=2507935 RepID=A0A3T1D415_9BACL|nr:hypothetical protein [Cohnella abietis]BBI32856.1 hypothetical protein KCTCHS21_22550 [Cohnella abietis]